MLAQWIRLPALYNGFPYFPIKPEELWPLSINLTKYLSEAYHKPLRLYHKRFGVYHKQFRVYHKRFQVNHKAIRVYHRRFRVYHKRIEVYHKLLRVYHRALNVDHRHPGANYKPFTEDHENNQLEPRRMMNR